MKKSDARIQRTNHNTPINSTENVVNEQNNTVNSVGDYPTPHPCDEGDTPAVPDKPKPNPNRPKTNNQQKTELIYTNGIQKVGNTVSVKVNPDSTNYIRTSEEGLSALFLVNKLECVKKSIKKLNDSVNQLKDEIQATSIIEKIVDNSNEFVINNNGLLELRIGKGLDTDVEKKIEVNCDHQSIGFNENGNIQSIWLEYTPSNE